MYTLKWSVLQYAIIRPGSSSCLPTEENGLTDERLDSIAVSIAGIICEAFDVLCESEWSVHFAGVYLEAVDFVSIRCVKSNPLVQRGKRS